jgi:hypothetical protein
LLGAYRQRRQPYQRQDELQAKENTAGTTDRAHTTTLFMSEPNGAHYAACLTRRAFFFHWDTEALPVYAITETRLVPAKVRILIDFLTDHSTAT